MLWVDTTPPLPTTVPDSLTVLRGQWMLPKHNAAVLLLFLSHEQSGKRLLIPTLFLHFFFYTWLYLNDMLLNNVEIRLHIWLNFMESGTLWWWWGFTSLFILFVCTDSILQSSQPYGCHLCGETFFRDAQFKCRWVKSLRCLTTFSYYRYDPKTDTWTTVSSLSVPRDAVGVCLLGDRLYAVGGYDGQSYLKTVESYDAQNNEWTEVITSFYYTLS